MCLFKQNKVTTAGAPAIAPRQDQDSAMLKPTDVTQTEEVKIEYGSSNKKASTAEGQRVGTDALRIPINEGASSGSETGGFNV